MKQRGGGGSSETPSASCSGILERNPIIHSLSGTLSSQRGRARAPTFDGVQGVPPRILILQTARLGVNRGFGFLRAA